MLVFRATKDLKWFNVMKLRDTLSRNLRQDIYLTPRFEGGIHWYNRDNLYDIRFFVGETQRKFPNIYKADPTLPFMTSGEVLKIYEYSHSTGLSCEEWYLVKKSFEQEPFKTYKDEHNIFLL